ncbi:DNA polymerase IV [Ectopseudomonas hydrolytica]|jgi:DNA polymerase-4|uniref:DNA polymerase IV n=1 Tax=Ectopseudomonas hydrolytica TaxID=2493633 RepID=UPI000C1FA006|nr:DNA polymerase IV [Pseudomonas hydrolytica]UTH31345.1 DNA polymerase IV [Pseudomonas hydrolytica]
MDEKKFIHIDMDSFFVSVELLDAPHLQSQPVAVGGSAAERGVISTANYIAREYGVKSGMATATAHRLCPNLVLLPTRFDAYEAVTKKLDAIFRRYTDKIEFLSLDEASLDVTGQPHCNGSATYMAAHIRAAIERELALTASAGVAPLRYLAKIASEVNKPNGLFVITPQNVRNFLDDLDVRKIPGVGPKTYSVLENLGCRLCSDVTEEKIPFLMHYLGVHGFYVWERCQGIEEHEEKVSDIKSLGVERTLPSDCTDFETCLEELGSLFKSLDDKISDACEDDNTIIKNLVKLKFSDFSISTTEAPATSLCKDTVNSLCRMLWDTRRQGRAVRLIGLSVKVKKKVNDDMQLELPW